MEDVLKTALGVFIGALAAMLTWEGIQYVRLEKAAYEARQEMARANAKMQADAKRRRELEQAERERQEEAMRGREQAIREREKADAEARRLAQLREQDKADAWKNYFKPTAECISDPNTMECANAHIRAKTEFEAQYRHKR
uniref:hypothetical protein n=1 Tax=Hylemonella sp. TaxID=2066020 RepID=UPI0035B3FA4D